MRRSGLVVFCIFLIVCKISAQTGKPSINEDDVKEIKTLSVFLIKEFEQLLNLISDEGVGYVKRNEIIENSYKNQSGQQLFKSPDVIIENDLQDGYKNDLKVAHYLKKFDLLYSKQSTNSISFENIQVFDVLEKDYIYLEVFFESYFLGGNIIENQPFPYTQRIATIEAKREVGTVWNLKILSIIFFNPKTHQLPEQTRIPIKEVIVNWENPDKKPNEYIIYLGDEYLTTTSDTFYKVQYHQHDTNIFQQLKIIKLKEKEDSDTKESNLVNPISNSPSKRKPKTNAVGIIILMITLPLIMIGLFTKN
ncbi:MAG: hypothetical protein KTR26_05045 [Flammeovirgaceae bacterium]|nr:hypothetical protein [Flammeovirgaceae bacterium]